MTFLVSGCPGAYLVRFTYRMTPMRKAVLVAMILSSGLLTVLSQRADAGWHHAAKSYAFGYCPCYIVPGCVNAPGYWACGSAVSYKVRGHHCCLRHHARVCVTRHRGYCRCGGAYCGSGFCGYGSCGLCSNGGGCGWGCSSEVGGCTGGGQTLTSGQTTGSEEVIYDGPAANAPPSASIQTQGAQNFPNSQYRLVSNKRIDGSAAFDRGLNAFRSHSLTDAVGAFDMAVEAEPDNAFYWYYRALTLFDLGNADAAGEALQKAVALEQDQPIANWGKRMERVQGRNRNWVENARRSAGLVR